MLADGDRGIFLLPGVTARQAGGPCIERLMSPLTENMRAALFMMASMAGFALNDALIKTTAGDLPLFQSVFLRGLVATGLIALLAARAGVLRLRVAGRDGRLVVLRCVGEIGSTFCFLTALFNMPLANASAILQSVPLAVALGAALFLAEPVGWRRYLAIGIGFLGVLVIVRPGSEGFNVYALWAVAAVGFIVLRDLSTRRLSPDIPSLQVTLLAAAAITAAAGFASLFGGWRPVAPIHAGALTLSALSLIVGYLFGVMTMRLGAIGFTQPFRYTMLPWAIMFGVLFFGEYPDAWMLVGSAIVVGTGLFTFYREQVVARLALERVEVREGGAVSPAPRATQRGSHARSSDRDGRRRRS
jgi:drug/metabolite transporter (DMT)-like permease